MQFQIEKNTVHPDRFDLHLIRPSGDRTIESDLSREDLEGLYVAMTEWHNSMRGVR